MWSAEGSFMMNEIAVGPIPTGAELTRERILEVAEVVFARHGLNGTRMREIAETAQVNKATIYSHFPSKAELHEAVLERGIQPMIDLLAEFSAGPRTMGTSLYAWSLISSHWLCAAAHKKRLPIGFH